ncbi:MAG: PAS domain-containing protein, partial [Deltaproteobacteria bacterium]|nr:PAS domain-containing protein [Deltaproteobacteria bacterium]
EFTSAQANFIAMLQEFLLDLEIYELFGLDKTMENLKCCAFLTTEIMAGKFLTYDRHKINALCKKINRDTSFRITVILPSGLVLGDSEISTNANGEIDHMDNLANRPEVKNALSGAVGTCIRYSPILKREMIYAAAPVKEGERIIGVVRTSIPVSSVRKSLKGIYQRVVLGSLAVVFFAALVSLIISRHINKPVEEMKKGADHFAEGDLAYRLAIPGSEELAKLAEAMNQMAVQLNERISTITHQKNELEAVLSSMVEAVFVIDTKERIIRFNRTAARLFDFEPTQAQGVNIKEMVENVDLQNFVSKTLSQGKPIEDDIVLHNGKDRFLQAHGTMLYDTQGKSMAALIVLNDITRLKKLENIRSEFVANVSHELRTPLTSIKGFVETLKNGALTDTHHAERFINIVSRQVDHLNAIIENLLSLSQIEQEAVKEKIVLERQQIKQALAHAAGVCGSKAIEKNIKIEIVCNDEIEAKISPALLEQAVVNLIDNAIKYSDPGKMVRIEAEKNQKEVIISIHDQGHGIAEEYLPRIFERFYRVNKAGSRKLGGIGLGLAIVQHIVQVHEGHIAVDSTLGKGSTFSLYLPI